MRCRLTSKPSLTTCKVIVGIEHGEISISLRVDDQLELQGFRLRITVEPLHILTPISTSYLASAVGNIDRGIGGANWRVGGSFCFDAFSRVFAAIPSFACSSGWWFYVLFPLRKLALVFTGCLERSFGGSL